MIDEKSLPKWAVTIAKSFSGKECFEFRLERLGKLHEYRAMVKKLQKETNMRLLDCQKKGQAEFGWLGSEQERLTYAQHLGERRGLGLKDNQAASARERYARKKNRSFEEMVAKLPANADPIVEMNWIKSHPAMTRKARAKNNDKILINEDDILNSSSGPAPSRAAAQQLQHWANSPDQFFKDILSETKKAKAKSEEEESKQRSQKTTKEIDAMLSGLFSDE
jgi:hypothetical protein